MKDIVVEILDESSIASIDIQQSLFDINQQIEQSKSKADQWDYYLSMHLVLFAECLMLSG